jgi:HSP20 family molecular chaperone IbpA
MPPLNVPIHRTNTDSSANKKDDIWFNAFDFTSGQDSNVRWLSRPNQQLVQAKYSYDTEKFRITFDVENFQADQIKIYIQNNRLTISGTYEEHSEGRFMQKQFERTFDIPKNADVDSMASFITAAHMLVVEIPLNPSANVDHLNMDSNTNNQRRLSFSLNKYSTSNNQGSLSTSNDISNLSTSNDISNLSTPGQGVRRTSLTKTMTTTTTGSSGIPPEAMELLRNAETAIGNTTQTYSSHTTERHSSNTGNQLVINESNTPSSSTTNKQTLLTSADVTNLPIDIPSELFAGGGTITIQKRRVSVTRETDGSTASVPATHSSNNESSTLSNTTSTTHSSNQTGVVPITRNNNNESTSSTNTNTTQSTHHTGVVPITRSNDTQSTSSNTFNQQQLNTLNQQQSNTLNQQQSNTIERLSSKTISSNNQSRMYTLEEFLQNKTWNPSLGDGPNGKKILHMRLQMKPGTTLDQVKISLNGYDLRVEFYNKVSSECGRQMSEQSYRQVTLFSTCDVDQLKTEFKDDGCLHIQVPITL